MAQFRLTINGHESVIDTDPERPLLEVLREDLKLSGTKYGCGEGQCRACTVILDGRPIVSCVTPVRSTNGKSILTIEGLADGDRLHRVQQAFLDEGAMQCGYCVPGMILRTAALLEAQPKATEAQVMEALNGSLCRCCGYPAILAAVHRAVAAQPPSDSNAGGVVR
jgi:aerobic-type carbon monoxide dehydrogenase small subunit (CoxS/CutS family)